MRSLLPLLWLPLAACASPPDDSSRSSAQATTVRGVVDRGSNGAFRVFELYGDFPAADQTRAQATCSGVRMGVEITYASRGQLNVFVAQPRGGAACTIELENLRDGARSSYGPVVSALPELEIAGANDRGVTSGRRFVELYGRYGAAHAQLEPRVLCAGVTVPARAEYTSPGQINVSMPDAGPASRCTFALRRRTDLLETPVFGAAPARTADRLPGVGAYFWGGLPPGPGALSGGQARLTAAGLELARIVLSPRSRVPQPDGNWYAQDLADSLRRCPTSEPFLPCVVKTPEYRAAMVAPELRTVVLTVTDSASNGPYGWDAHFLDPDWYTRDGNGDRVTSEYRALTVALYEEHQGSGKTFLVANWETDNMAYCGSAYGYATDPAVRARCDGTPTGPARSFAGLTRWFSARKRGIAEGRALALGRNLGGMHVADAIEINSARFLQDAGLGATLERIVPQVLPEFVTYSSYDSQYSARMEEDLASLKAKIAPARLIVGEIGFERHGADPTHVFRTVETAKAIQRAQVAGTVLWEAFDTWSAQGGATVRVQPWGVLDPDGRDRLVMASLRAELTQQARDIARPSGLRIAGVHDRGVTGAWRFYELYGAFGQGAVTPTVVCDGIDARAEATYTSPGQVNVRIPHEPSRDRFCVLRVTGAGGASSLAYGPRLAASR